jgi:hypothetical protein
MNTFNILCGSSHKFNNSFIFLTDWTAWIRSQAEAKDSSFRLCAQTSSEFHPVSYQMGTGGPFPGGKVRPGRDADYLPPSSTEVTRSYFLSHLALHGVAGQLYFLLYFYSHIIFNICFVRCFFYTCG